MAAYSGYTLQMKMLFPGSPIMVHDTHTKRRSQSVDKQSVNNNGKKGKCTKIILRK